MSRFSSTIYWSDFCFPHKIIWPLKAGFISWLPVVVCWYVYSLPLLLICIIYKERFVLLIWKAKRERGKGEREKMNVKVCPSIGSFLRWSLWPWLGQTKVCHVNTGFQRLGPSNAAFQVALVGSWIRSPEPGLELVLVWDTLIKVVVLPTGHSVGSLHCDLKPESVKGPALWIDLLGAWGFRLLSRLVIPFHLDKFPGVGWLDYKVDLFSDIRGVSILSF